MEKGIWLSWIDLLLRLNTNFMYDTFAPGLSRPYMMRFFSILSTVCVHIRENLRLQVTWSDNLLKWSQVRKVWLSWLSSNIFGQASEIRIMTSLIGLFPVLPCYFFYFTNITSWLLHKCKCNVNLSVKKHGVHKEFRACVFQSQTLLEISRESVLPQRLCCLYCTEQHFQNFQQEFQTN